MSAFTDEPSVSYAADAARKLGRDLWRVKSPFSFLFQWKGEEAKVNIPRGYLTDGASVPRIFWSVVPPWGIYGAAAIIHDFLCEYLVILVDGKLQKISRKEADQIFVAAMRELRVPEDKIKLIEGAVGTYREVWDIENPVWHQDKAKIEAEWAAANP